MKVLVFCPTWRLEPETWEAIFAQQWDGPIDRLFARDNPFRQDDGGKANVLYNYRKARRTFLTGKWDAMLVIESDVIPPPDALRKLAATGGDVAYGLYLFRRGWPYPVNVFRFVEGPFPDQPLTTFPEAYQAAWGKVVRCSGSGLGCTLIRREVLEAVDFRACESHCDTCFTEDTWRAGFKMMADMSAICGHKRPDGVILWPTREGKPTATVGETGGFRGAVDRDPTEEFEERLHGGALPTMDESGQVRGTGVMKVKMLESVNISIDGRSRRCAPGDVIEVPPNQAEQLVAAGYATPAAATKVIDGPPAANATKDLGGDLSDLSKWTVPQLRALAELREIDLGKARRKADIIKALEESE